MLNIGVVGYGNRIRAVVEQIEAFGNVSLVAIADPRADEIRSELSPKGKSVSLYSDADAMLEQEQLDGVLIGTRCSLHAELAAKVARTGVPLFLEKPVATSYEGVAVLERAFSEHPTPVVVSFPLRVTPLLRRVKEIIDSGLIGTVEQVQAFNYVPYGDIYYAGWYRDHVETGGLFLQKATHDFDYLGYLIGQRPVSVAAMKSQRVYGGDKPRGLKCAHCDEQRDCMESPYNLFVSRRVRPTPFDENRMCLFGEEVENEDNAAVLVEYENGVQMSYVQNFFARNNAKLRGARLVGYKGTLDFDWYRGEILVHLHHSRSTERIEFDTSAWGHHFGGDLNLARNFIGVMQGDEASETTLAAGIQSVLLCLAARESAETRHFVKVEAPKVSV